MRLVDQHAGRRHLLEGPPMHRRLSERHGGAHGAAELNHLLAHAHGSEQARQQAGLVPGHGGRLVDARVTINHPEQAGRILGGLRGAEEHVTAGIKGVAERAAHLFLQVAIEIDHHVSA